MASGNFRLPTYLKPIAEILKKSATAAFRRTILGGATAKLRAKPSRAGGGDRKAAQRVFGKMTRRDANKIKSAMKGSDFGRFVDQIERYGKSEGKDVRTFLESLGSMGKVVSLLIGQTTDNPAKARGQTVPKDMKVALDFVGAFADQPTVIEALQRILEGAGARVEWPAGIESPADRRGGGGLGGGGRGGGRGGRGGGGSGVAGGEDSGGGDGGGGRGGRMVTVPMGGRNGRFPPSHPIVTGDMVQTPQSSNVYAFGYDIDVKTLYVRFKLYLPGSEGSKSGKRDHAPGAIYAYYNCPPELFLRFLNAGSKGKFVWDKLRIRGTVSGHQLDYSLVGVQESYVPRKATYTPAGEAYIPRTVFTDDNRRIESQFGHELVRPFQKGKPKDGKPKGPNRGRPNTGRP